MQAVDLQTAGYIIYWALELESLISILLSLPCILFLLLLQPILLGTSTAGRADRAARQCSRVDNAGLSLVSPSRVAGGSTSGSFLPRPGLVVRPLSAVLVPFPG